MKKLLFCILTTVFLAVGTAGAVPIPFQVGTGGTLTDSSLGILNFNYTALGSGPYLLDQGDSTGVIPLFSVTLSNSMAAGMVDR